MVDAKRFLAMKRYCDAANLLEGLLAENPRDKYATSMLIKVHALTGRLDLAEAVFKRAVELEIADAHIYSAMITAFCRAGKVSEAESLRDGAKKAGLDEGYIHCSKIDAYGRLRMPAKAREIFDVVKETHGDTALYTSMIKVHIMNGELPVASLLLTEAVNRGFCDPDLFHSVMKGYGYAGQSQAAREVCGIALAKQKASVATCSIMAEIYYAEGAFGKIVDFVDSLPRELRKVPLLQLRAADALRKMGRYDDAIRAADCILKKSRISPDKREHAALILGYSLMHSGKAEEAFNLFTKLSMTVPDNSVHYPRIMCGIVFAWQQLDYDAHMRPEDIDRVLSKLRHLQAHGTGNGIRHDVCQAISILEERYSTR